MAAAELSLLAEARLWRQSRRKSVVREELKKNPKLIERKAKSETIPHLKCSEKIRNVEEWLETRLGAKEGQALDSLWQQRRLERIVSSPDAARLTVYEKEIRERKKREQVPHPLYKIDGTVKTHFAALDMHGDLSGKREEILLKLGDPSRQNRLAPLVPPLQLQKPIFNTKFPEPIRSRAKLWRQTSFRQALCNGQDFETKLNILSPKAKKYKMTTMHDHRFFGLGKRNIFSQDHGCTLSTEVLERRASRISQSQCILSVVGVGLAGRIYIPSHVDVDPRRHLLFIAYLPNHSIRTECKVSLPLLEQSLDPDLLRAGCREQLIHELVTRRLFFKYTLKKTNDDSVKHIRRQHLEAWPSSSTVVAVELAFSRKAQISGFELRLQARSDKKAKAIQEEARLRARPKRYRNCLATIATRMNGQFALVRCAQIGTTDCVQLLITSIPDAGDFRFALSTEHLLRIAGGATNQYRQFAKKISFVSNDIVDLWSTRSSARQALKSAHSAFKGTGVRRSPYRALEQQRLLRHKPHNLYIGGSRLVPRSSHTTYCEHIQPPKKNSQTESKPKSIKKNSRRQAGRGVRVAGGAALLATEKKCRVLYELIKIDGQVWYELDVYEPSESISWTLRLHKWDLDRVAKKPRESDSYHLAARRLVTQLVVCDQSMHSDFKAKLGMPQSSIQKESKIVQPIPQVNDDTDAANSLEDASWSQLSENRINSVLKRDDSDNSLMSSLDAGEDEGPIDFGEIPLQEVEAAAILPSPAENVVKSLEDTVAHLDQEGLETPEEMEYDHLQDPRDAGIYSVLHDFEKIQSTLSILANRVAVENESKLPRTLPYSKVGPWLARRYDLAHVPDSSALVSAVEAYHSPSAKYGHLSTIALLDFLEKYSLAHAPARSVLRLETKIFQEDLSLVDLSSTANAEGKKKARVTLSLMHDIIHVRVEVPLETSSTIEHTVPATPLLPPVLMNPTERRQYARQIHEVLSTEEDEGAAEIFLSALAQSLALRDGDPLSNEPSLVCQPIEMSEELPEVLDSAAISDSILEQMEAEASRKTKKRSGRLKE